MEIRPLTGEPFALDLVNTEWIAAGQRQDLLATDEGLSSWLAGSAGARSAREAVGERDAGQPGAEPEGAAALGEARLALVATRAALRAVLERPGDGAARTGLNAVLDRGRVRRRLSDDGPRAWVEVDGEAWEAAWRAAADLLDLLERAPERVRRCGNPDCVLYFLDTSKNGSRRWCAMATCGNRLKAQRHHRRAGRPPAPPRPSAGT